MSDTESTTDNTDASETTETTEEPMPAEFQPIDEDTDRTVEFALDWVCWVTADHGERFYPPQDSAVECVDGLFGEDRDRSPVQSGYFVGQELGQHTRAYVEAIELFTDLERMGFDPVARAERHLAYSRDVQGLDLPDIDWTWLEESYYEGEVPGDG